MGERRLASRALSAVQAMRDSEYNSKFKTQCKKSPSLLVQSGLAQTVTFLRARERDKGMIGETYLEHLVEVMGRDTIQDVGALQRRALSSDLSDYMALTQAVQTAMIWMRRFAQVEMANVREDRGD